MLKVLKDKCSNKLKTLKELTDKKLMKTLIKFINKYSYKQKPSKELTDKSKKKKKS